MSAFYVILAVAILGFFAYKKGMLGNILNTKPNATKLKAKAEALETKAKVAEAKKKEIDELNARIATATEKIKNAKL